MRLAQTMEPLRAVFQAGDVVTFRCRFDGETPAGTAWLRTTIGSAAVQRREVIEFTENGTMLTGLAWRDLAMQPDGEGGFLLRLPLTEPGVFDAKCCFKPTVGGKLLWPSGENFHLKVEAAANVASNVIYCAFVRQFGGAALQPVSERESAAARLLDAAGYAVIPPSGTFRQLIARLDHIFDDLGCRILQLLPIHPTPTVYGRMGRFGSPFAATDYFAVDPALADFDRAATPLEQFLELIDAVHARRGRLFLDIPVNHTGWASKVQQDHPDYFVRGEDRVFESPGAWGTTWEDLCKLNYADTRVHHLMAEVFLFWCRHGVDGFRCDAGYMLPAAAWDYIVAKVRDEFPDTVFMLEGLGGKLEVQEQLLGASGLDWAYSEFFQNYTRDEISRYQPYVADCSARFGTLVNFAETHDNSRLAAVSATYSAMRCALTALLSENGAFGYANGVEFLAREKIDVHGAGSLNWGAEPNLIGLLRRLSAVFAVFPAFQAGSRVRLIQHGGGNLVVALRTAPDGETMLAAVNLDCERPATAHWSHKEFWADEPVELMRGAKVWFAASGDDAGCDLGPGDFMLFCSAPDALRRLENELTHAGEPGRVTRQRAWAAAYALWREFRADDAALPDFDAARELCRDPWQFCIRAAGTDLPGVTRYRIGRDERRVVPLPPGEILLLESETPFRVGLYDGCKVSGVTDSLPRDPASDGEFALVTLPENPSGEWRLLEIHLKVYGAPGPARRCGQLLQLGKPGRTVYRLRQPGSQVEALNLYAFAANDRGGMTMMRGAWGELGSKYDAILAANGGAAYPVDRRTLFTRLRAWLVAEDYSCEINRNTLADFTASPHNRAEWRFTIPAGQGRLAALRVELFGALDGDAVRLRFARPAAEEDAAASPPVKLILRPDLEDRPNHHVTKAYQGAEAVFPLAVREQEKGFDFVPAADRERLQIRLSRGTYVSQPEWHYMVELPLEKYYGQDFATDLFSPGYFEFSLAPGESVELFAAAAAPGCVVAPEQFCWPEEGDLPGKGRPEILLREELRAFVVRRDEYSTVIAGYPWFLDWGRDTLIVLRGLIRAGVREPAAAILRQFAAFEENGTIPNVIHGDQVGNRDTSDAPLWLLVAARDYVDFFGDEEILDTDCRGRRFREVLLSIIENYRQGTPNGIRMDAASSLIFSPSHFTWMDTNYPAGTPREGYPIEIQALWFAALEFVGRFEPRLAKLAGQVREAIEEFFFLPHLDRFSDCLHAAPGLPATEAVPDDHIRPNQLLALTLGAVRDRQKQLAILNGAAELLLPGSIRSLSDRTVEYRLPVRRDSQLLNDPGAPYWGHYSGPEDTSRKVAYHNGTGWGWPFPSYCEALFMVGGDRCRLRALALLDSTALPAESGIPGMLPEVSEGNAPHRDGGCLAQAWSVSEAYRVYQLLREPRK